MELYHGDYYWVRNSISPHCPEFPLCSLLPLCYPITISVPSHPLFSNSYSLSLSCWQLQTCQTRTEKIQGAHFDSRELEVKVFTLYSLTFHSSAARWLIFLAPGDTEISRAEYKQRIFSSTAHNGFLSLQACGWWHVGEVMKLVKVSDLKFEGEIHFLLSLSYILIVITWFRDYEAVIGR